MPPEFQERLRSRAAEELSQINSVLNALNTQIMHAVQRGGQAYLSSATIGGKFALRACITNFRTTRADIDKTLEIIRETARQIEERRLDQGPPRATA